MLQFPTAIFRNKNLGFHTNDPIFTPVLSADAFGVILKNNNCRTIILETDIDIFRNQPNRLVCLLNATKKVSGNCINAIIQGAD